MPASAPSLRPHVVVPALQVKAQSLGRAVASGHAQSHANAGHGRSHASGSACGMNRWQADG
eukprot:scaffold4057_cov124-Pinguiococcus_pyrenoidosus.AAC.1